MKNEIYESLAESDIMGLVLEDNDILNVPILPKNIKNQRLKTYGRHGETSDFKQVPEEILFSDKTFWSVFNETTNKEYEVNGNIINFWLTPIPGIRERLECREIDAFKTLNMKIKFKKAIY